MTSRKVLCAVFVVLLLAVLTVVWAQQPAPPPTPAGKEMPSVAPAPPDKRLPMEREKMMEQRRKMMEAMRDPAKARELLIESGVSADKMDQCQAALERPVYLDDPQSILAQAAKLKLTGEQKTKLQALVKDMRQKALAVLTADQKKALGPVPDKPASAKEMVANLMETMSEKIDPYMYPMMRSMIMRMLGMEEAMRPRMMQPRRPETGVIGPQRPPESQRERIVAPGREPQAIQRVPAEQEKKDE